MRQELARVERISAREVWLNEATDFTPWMCDHIEELGGVLGLNLRDAKPEQSTGNFWVDIVAQDEDGGTVVIENQLEKSDHDHLGKLLTYLASYGANTAVWVTPEARQEHVNAITWLNESGLAQFFLVKVEVIRIAGSPPAPLFTQIAGPSEIIEKAGDQKRESTESKEMLRRFWTGLLERARQKTSLHDNVSPSNWWGICTPTGKPNVSYYFYVQKHAARVELAIDKRGDDGEYYRRAFDALKQFSIQIEEDFGEPLEWVQSETSLIRRIGKLLPDGGSSDEERWPEIHDRLIDTMIRFEKAIGPYIAKIQE